jgi:hypothetical protein
MTTLIPRMPYARILSASDIMGMPKILAVHSRPNRSWQRERGLPALPTLLPPYPRHMPLARCFKLSQQLYHSGFEVARPPLLLGRGDDVWRQGGRSSGDLLSHDIFNPLRVGHKGVA